MLDYLIEELEKTEAPIHYLLDERVRGKHPKIKESNIVDYREAGMLVRKQFYRQNETRVKTVFCFANIPPAIKGKFKSYTYFHNLILLEVPKEFSLIARLKFLLKIRIIKALKKNTDYWWVQTEYVQKNLSRKLGVSVDRVKLFPFYPSFGQGNLTIEREKNSFLFVSNATPNKNHEKLINAFCSFYDEFQIGKLILTINTDYPQVLELIEQRKKSAYPIENFGFFEREKLAQIYQAAEYLIYPSVNESFGLGLVEGIENGCKVVGANLPYTEDACVASLKFNPFDQNAIRQAFVEAVKRNLPESTSKIENQITRIVQILTGKES